MFKLWWPTWNKALSNYVKAKNSWEEAAIISKKYYLPDLTYGPQSWLRGRWDDRLPAIKADIIKHLWEIIISDKTVDQYESNLMRRVCGLIYFPDKMSAEIKLQILNK